MVKTMADTYLYSKYNEYEKKIFSFLVNGFEVDKTDKSFENILFDIKRRQTANFMVKLIMSDKIILLSATEPMPKAFKVMCCRDVKNNKNDKKIYIDVNGIIGKDSSGNMVCSSVDILISHLLNALVNYVYYIDEKRLVNNSTLIKSGASAFASLMTHIVDFVSKISTISNNRAKCVYLSSMYYLENILGKDVSNPSIRNVAVSISGLTPRDADMVDMQCPKDCFGDLKSFVDAMSKVLKINGLTVDVIVERWMYIYGEGTPFALEFYPAFSAMITDAYVGSYINNQKSIEKIVGTDMIIYSKAILQLGSDVL